MNTSLSAWISVCAPAVVAVAAVAEAGGYFRAGLPQVSGDGQAR